MRTIYAIQLQIAPADGQSASSTHTDLVLKTCHWLERKYKRTWGVAVSVPVDGQAIAPCEGHSIKVVSQSVGNSDLFALDWTHLDDSDPSTAWVINCVVARHVDSVQIALLLRISTTRTVLRPVRFDLSRPILVTEVLDGFRTLMDDWPVPRAVEQISGSSGKCVRRVEGT